MTAPAKLRDLTPADLVLGEIETSVRPRSVYEIAASTGLSPEVVRLEGDYWVSAGAAVWTSVGELADPDVVDGGAS